MKAAFLNNVRPSEHFEYKKTFCTVDKKLQIYTVEPLQHSGRESVSDNRQFQSPLTGLKK